MDSLLFFLHSSPDNLLHGGFNQATTIMNLVCVFPVYFKYLYKYQCICEQIITVFV